MDEKGKGNGLNLDFKIDPEDIINPSRRTANYQPVKAQRPLWIDIMIGIVAAMFLIWAIWFGFITFSAWSLSKVVERSAEKARIHQVQQQQINTQERQRQEQVRLQEVQRQERLRQLASPQCRFWTDHYRNNQDQRSLENVRRYCPD
ncbi:hypothetical protein [Nitrincola sp.]|uniref:hypothetical protein n=1 Tax=Nitrincola sp. TaxID=1926584 RepID=UPI003A94CC38